MMRYYMTLLLFLVVSSAQIQNDSVFFAGVRLRLGMDKGEVLKSLAARENVKVSSVPGESGRDWYMVTVREFDEWKLVGDLLIQNGKLGRICIEHFAENQKEASTLARAIYSAVRAGGKPIDVWTGVNDDANNPIYETHIVFPDRETVISSTSIHGSEEASVKTYFPRVIRVAQK